MMPCLLIQITIFTHSSKLAHWEEDDLQRCHLLIGAGGVSSKPGGHLVAEPRAKKHARRQL